MRIVVMNGSPRPNGNTEMMAKEFIRGAEEAGHETELINLRGKKITGCLGCQYCFSHDGVCVQKDDMKEILASLDQADMMVIASPIYWFDITSQLKAVIDRFYAKGMNGFAFNRVALLLDADSDHVFDAAVSQYRQMCNYLNWKNMGIITAPNLEKLGGIAQSPALKDAYELGKSLR